MLPSSEIRASKSIETIPNMGVDNIRIEMAKAGDAMTE